MNPFSAGSSDSWNTGIVNGNDENSASYNRYDSLAYRGMKVNTVVMLKNYADIIISESSFSNN